MTHPHHPLYGQRVTIVRIRQGADPDLIVRLADGDHAAIAMSWTNYATTSRDEAREAPLPLLALDGLAHMVTLVARLRPDRGPAPAHTSGVR